VSRGRGRGRLAPSKLSGQLDGPSSAMSNGDGSITGADSSDEADAARQERFSKTEPGNQYEQVRLFTSLEARKLTLNS
jgi:hypothetical protein